MSLGLNLCPPQRGAAQRIFHPGVARFTLNRRADKSRRAVVFFGFCRRRDNRRPGRSRPSSHASGGCASSPPRTDPPSPDWAAHG